jgi:ABC-type glycerol-3-phosphate transport system substrate-binding protein
MTRVLTILGLVVLGVLMYLGATIRPRPPAPSGRIRVAYWEKWTGFEADAMRRVVNAFNRRQKRIWVEMLTVSQIDQKMSLATAGGTPPDVCGLWSANINVYAERGALMPLDSYLRRAGITRADYIPAYWDLCSCKGRMWCLPSTPASLALHWNKRLFRQAGLDPDKPPRTIEELDRYAERLTERTADGRIARAGFMPAEPGWWNWSWGYYFGGRLWDGRGRITADEPENVRAFRWVRSYSQKYGTQSLEIFRSGFGNFSSPQNAFLSDKVAMVLQGVWMANFIHKYAPQMEWGAAPFPVPADRPELANVAYVECDTLCIPAGAKHPREGFEFIKYVNSIAGSEMLCSGQGKHTPLARTTPQFIRNHPNRYIKVFIDVAKRERPFSTPQLGIWAEYSAEMTAAFDRVWLGQGDARAVLRKVTARMQQKLDRDRERRG